MKNKQFLKHRRHLLCLFIGLISFGNVFVISESQQKKHNYVPPKGYVPDPETAVLIAQAVCIPIYGADQVKQEMPFRATLYQGTWLVKGYLAPKYKGGVAMVEIAKVDGRIISVTHGK